MEIQLKQRIIGAVVIFTLLIVFLPMIFETDEEERYVEQILEPQVPKVPNVVESDGFVINKSALMQDAKPIGADSNIDTQNVPNNKIQNIEKVLLENSNSKSRISKTLSTSSTSSDNMKSKVIDLNSDSIYKKFDEYKYKPATHKDKSVQNNKNKPVELISLKPLQDKMPVKTNEISKPSQEAKKSQPASPASLVSGTISSKPEPQKATESKTETVATNINSYTNKDVYAVLIGAYNSKTDALKLREELESKGYPVYISNKKNKYHVYVGPELELQYIKELSKRVIDETNYKPQIVSHRWTGA